MANTLDYDIVVSGSELDSCYYNHFRAYILDKDINLLTPLSYRLNSNATVLP